jgi:hypothetical protein
MPILVEIEDEKGRKWRARWVGMNVGFPSRSMLKTPHIKYAPPFTPPKDYGDTFAQYKPEPDCS